MHPLDGLVRPIVSEKSLLRREAVGQYTFEVGIKLSKDQIVKALSKMFDVKVESVNTLIKRHRPRRRGAHYTKPHKTKTAVVTLAKGQKIGIFEDQ